jgi:exodeoxyribonuclease VII small subunit
MDNALSFEQAYKRLEEILDLLNNSQISLEDSLKVYEEADKLIQQCSEKLNHAEQKVQVLVKNRQQETTTFASSPVLEDFTTSRQQHLNRNFSQ